jgi:hypothetical protein
MDAYTRFLIMRGRMTPADIGTDRDRAARWRNVKRKPTATEAEIREKTGFSLQAIASLNREMFAHLATDEKGGES